MLSIKSVFTLTVSKYCKYWWNFFPYMETFGFLDFLGGFVCFNTDTELHFAMLCLLIKYRARFHSDKLWIFGVWCSFEIFYSFRDVTSFRWYTSARCLIRAFSKGSFPYQCLLWLKTTGVLINRSHSEDM